MSALIELIGRLCARADNARHTAERMREMHYEGEALMWDTRAATYTEAAEIANQLLRAARPDRWTFVERLTPEAWLEIERQHHASLNGPLDGGVEPIVSQLVQRKEASNG